MIKQADLVVIASPTSEKDSSIAGANESMMPPMKVIEEFGEVSVSDGSSFFTFSKDGSFESGPLGGSGRTMKGHWIKDADGHFVATAKLGWINGLQLGGDRYRRIVFWIPHVTKRKEEPGKIRKGMAPSTVFDSYFFIEEMVSIPKPPEGILQPDPVIINSPPSTP